METLLVAGRRTKEYAKDKKGEFILDANGQRTLSDKDLVDKNGKKFCVLMFATPDTIYTRNSKGQMVALAQPQVFVDGYTAWEISNLQSNKGNSDFGWNLEEGQEVVGTIVKRRVEEYEVNGKMVTTASVVTFANTDKPESFEIDVQAQFARKGHKLVSAVGTPIEEPAAEVIEQQVKTAK